MEVKLRFRYSAPEEVPCHSQGGSMSLPWTLPIAHSDGLYRLIGRSLSLPIAPQGSPVEAPYRSLGRSLSLPRTFPFAHSDALYHSLRLSLSLPRTLPIALQDSPLEAAYRSLGRCLRRSQSLLWRLTNSDQTFRFKKFENGGSNGHFCIY
ncbi:unnamed protein product [Nesidiocoris tenuis]|uniref:Uncharacterized protein n=1 Tax=Nesidiocoris tenuis TaxID=355587 RepID=A0A6H5GUZ4_9HEMI|nr:unnamed protein product [Nesidiocoris tenuis]